MYTIKLKNNKSFSCDENTTVFEAARKAGIYLEHSCLSARCRSCSVKIESGRTINCQEENVLTDTERSNNIVLSCNVKPKSDLTLDIEDLGDIILYDKKIFPAKINTLEFLSDDILKVVLRLPPSVKFGFNSGQYVNLIKNNINRSYSLANNSLVKNELEFFIKKYKNGQMSNYWFNEAKINDLLRVEGPLGSFFLRDSDSENLIFLATGTGVAPIKSILDNLESTVNENFNKKIWVIVGARYRKDLFWKPDYKNISIKFIETLSREKDDTCMEGYVQDIIVNQDIDFTKSDVYACGSSEMIESSKDLLTEKYSLNKNKFYSDAFVQTN